MWKRIAFLLGALWLVALTTACGAPASKSIEPPRAADGVLDLTDVNLSSTLEQLNGQWSFTWNHLLTPDQMTTAVAGKDTEFIRVPSPWNDGVVGQRFPADGFATMALQIRLSPANSRAVLGLYVPIENTAYKLWVDGTLLASVGQVGTSATTAVPHYLPRTVYFQPKSTTVDVVMQVSNFVQRSGGLWKSPVIGEAQALDHQQKRMWELHTFLLGTLFVIGIYHAGVSLFRKTEKSSLYFGILTIAVGLRELFVGHMFAMQWFPSIPWGLDIRIEYLGGAVAVPMMTEYLRAMFPQEFWEPVRKVLWGVPIAYSGVVLFTSPHLFTRWVSAFMYFTVVAAVYGVWVILLAVRRRRNHALVILLAMLVFSLVLVNNTLYYSYVIISGDWTVIGFLVFVVMQSWILLKDLATSFHRVERMSRELVELNNSLERRVKIRTLELEQSQQDLQEANKLLANLAMLDELTGMANRRFFTDAFHNEWNQALRQGIPLSILMIDIDHFKQYNDTYGHVAGDECLRKVADVMKHTLRRPTDVLARYGGEEFVTVLLNTDAAGAKVVARNLRSAVEGLAIPHSASKVHRVVTVSIGIATVIPRQGQLAKQLVEHADKALYWAKEQGRNRCATYDEMDAPSPDGSGDHV